MSKELVKLYIEVLRYERGIIGCFKDQYGYFWVEFEDDVDWLRTDCCCLD